MSVPEKMYGVLLTGHGGLDKLEWRDNLDVPNPGEGEVLIRVLASSVNNTDINTRTAWYSKSVRGDTASGAVEGNVGANTADGGWSGEPILFPRIQGADCCGVIVAVGAGVPGSRIGERILVRALQSTGASGGLLSTWTFGSECNGAFAQFTKTFATDALPVQSDLSDTELGAIPCAYSTAETMLQKVGLNEERVLVTGASGGVGFAAIQLAKRRGAHVTAMTSADKAEAIRSLGADKTLSRDDPATKEVDCTKSFCRYDSKTCVMDSAGAKFGEACSNRIDWVSDHWPVTGSKGIMLNLVVDISNAAETFCRDAERDEHGCRGTQLSPTETPSNTPCKCMVIS